MALRSNENPLGQLANPTPLDQFIYNHGQTTSAQLVCDVNIYPGIYYVKAASGGGAHKWEQGYWYNATNTGGSGAVWEGQLGFDSIVNLVAHVNPADGNNGGAMAVYINGTRIFHLSGGVYGGGAGGTLTQDNALAPYVQLGGNVVDIAKNGANGYRNQSTWGSPSSDRVRGYSTGTTDMASGLYWGEGGGSKGGATQGGFSIKRLK